MNSNSIMWGSLYPVLPEGLLDDDQPTAEFSDAEHPSSFPMAEPEAQTSSDTRSLISSHHEIICLSEPHHQINWDSLYLRDSLEEMLTCDQHNGESPDTEQQAADHDPSLFIITESEAQIFRAERALPHPGTAHSHHQIDWDSVSPWSPPEEMLAYAQRNGESPDTEQQAADHDPSLFIITESEAQIFRAERALSLPLPDTAHSHYQIDWDSVHPGNPPEEMLTYDQRHDESPSLNKIKKRIKFSDILDERLFKTVEFKQFLQPLLNANILLCKISSQWSKEHKNHKIQTSELRKFFVEDLQNIDGNPGIKSYCSSRERVQIVYESIILNSVFQKFIIEKMNQGVDLYNSIELWREKSENPILKTEELYRKIKRKIDKKEKSEFIKKIEKLFNKKIAIHSKINKNKKLQILIKKERNLTPPTTFVAIAKKWNCHGTTKKENKLNAPSINQWYSKYLVRQLFNLDSDNLNEFNSQNYNILLEWAKKKEVFIKNRGVSNETYKAGLQRLQNLCDQVRAARLDLPSSSNSTPEAMEL